MRSEVRPSRGAGWLVAALALALACGSSPGDLFPGASAGGRTNAGGGAGLLGAAGRPAGTGGLPSAAGGESDEGGSSGEAGREDGQGGEPQGGQPQGGQPQGGQPQGGQPQGGQPQGGQPQGGQPQGGQPQGGQGGQPCIGEDAGCRRPVSCAELHRASPGLLSGRYALQPTASANPSFSYCEMSAEGGGWTLILNMGPAFDRSTAGVPNALCYNANCTNLSYSRVLLEADVMLDMSDTPIVGTSYESRAIITDLDPAVRGRTVRALFNSGPNYIDNDDNSNVVLRFSASGSCLDLLQEDLREVFCTECGNGADCESRVLVFGDSDSRCGNNPPSFSIGAAVSRSVAWGNCAGWPQLPNPGGRNYYPDYFRVWVR